MIVGILKLYSYNVKIVRLENKLVSKVTEQSVGCYRKFIELNQAYFYSTHNILLLPSW